MLVQFYLLLCLLSSQYIIDEIKKHLSHDDLEDFYNITMNHFLSKSSKDDIKDMRRELYILVNN